MAAACRVQIKHRLELQFGNGKPIHIPDDLLVEDWICALLKLIVAINAFPSCPSGPGREDLFEAKANFPAHCKADLQ